MLSINIPLVQMQTVSTTTDQSTQLFLSRIYLLAAVAIIVIFVILRLVVHSLVRSRLYLFLLSAWQGMALLTEWESHKSIFCGVSKETALGSMVILLMMMMTATASTVIRMSVESASPAFRRLLLP